MVEQKTIEVVYIPTRDMVADTLTKPLPRDQDERFMTMMGLRKLYACQLEENLQQAIVAAEALGCQRCHQTFSSKNKLYKHLRGGGHEC